jgi:splicing factor 3B subunit 1
MAEEIRRLQQARAKGLLSSEEGEDSSTQRDGLAGGSKVALSSVGGGFDSDLYGSGGDKFAGFSRSVVEEEEEEEDDDDEETVRHGGMHPSSRRGAVAQSMLKEGAGRDDGDDPFERYREAGGSGLVNTRIADRESEYQRRGRINRTLSPERGDAFGDATPARSYKDIIQNADLDRQKEELLRRAAIKVRDGEKLPALPAAEAEEEEEEGRGGLKKGKRRRWDQPAASSESSWEEAETPVHPSLSGSDTPAGAGGWSAADSDSAAASSSAPKKRRNRWDETPTTADATPRASRWDDATPASSSSSSAATPSRKRSRWDETPVAAGAGLASATPAAYGAETPMGLAGMATPSGAALSAEPMTPEVMQRIRWEREIEERNRPLSDAELDAMFPETGYRILDPPPGYVPLRAPGQQMLLATPTPMGQTPGFKMMETPAREEYGIPPTSSESSLPFIKPEDYQYFGKLMEEVDEEELDPEQAKERRILTLLLKIKSGTPPQRKTALRQITDKARELGAGPLFNQILPLLMSPALEDQERHLLVKVIDRVLYKLDDLVRPYVHKILVVIEPLLIDEDYYARVEGREIISNLSKAAGLATMIATMRPDIDNVDEYVRNTTARAFAVVASALGIPALLPFLKAVCQSRKSWQARHTGIKIVQQIAILMGCAVLPHLRQMVSIAEHGLTDEQQKVRTITALALSSLAEAAHPYGIESFDSVLRPLWKGIRTHRGKGLAAFLKAIGFIIPLMDANYANYYTREVMVILIREFQSPDEEMKKIVLKVVKQCVGTEGVEPAYVREEILPEFFRNFWVRRMALDRRNYRQVVETTVEIASKVGLAEVVGRVVDDLKDESEPYRRMVMETVEQVMQNLGAADVDERLEEQLVDGVLYAFQEQQAEGDAAAANAMLSGFGTVVNALGLRCKPYLPQITGTIKWRLNNKSARVRMQAADLIGRVAVVMKVCEEDTLMGHLGVVLYEYLGEEYPEVLGSMLGALKAIVNVIGMTKMTPPIKDLLPRLTPILKNRHEKVQENCIDLVGRIADRGAEMVSAREWMRICFELLEMLKAPKKAIRRAAVNTFGYIAKAVGPQDVLHTLLNNLKVQERQNRVCTTVAIAIVAETCSPFTVIPALMNEYRVPELNVQNGVLKALSFMFEYIGEMGSSYIYAVTPLLEDALMDRDLVHRQTACTTVKHLALGVAGLGCEDALMHMLNFVWPNIFETSPHVINAVMEAIEGIMVGAGAVRVLQYVLQGLYHPARRVREVYWKVYNSLYIYAADALTAAYPRLEDDSRNSYRRTHLDLFL